MIEWFKKLRRIVQYYDKDKEALHRAIGQNKALINSAVKLIKERTSVHADIHQVSENHIIVVGTYRGRDYVQTYRIENTELRYLIELLRDMEKFAKISKVDAVPGIKAVIDKEIQW